MYISAENPRYSIREEVTRPLAVVAAGYVSTEDYDVTLEHPYGTPNYILIFIKEGLAYLRRGGREMWLDKNCIILFHPNEPQELIFFKKEATEASWVIFSGTDVTRILEDIDLDGIQISRLSGDTLSPLTEQMMRELPESGAYQDDLLNSLLLQALVRTAQNRAIEGPVSEIDKAIEKIKREYNKDIPAAEYARKCGISTSHFMRLFKQRTGTSPHDFRLKLRIEAARSLLVSTDCTVTVIANQVGFKDPFHFSSYFKQVTGLSPQNYREKERQK